MPVSLPRYTLEDLDSFPDDGNRYELVGGVLLVTPAPMPPHDIVAMRFLRMLFNYFRPDQVADVFARGSVEIAPDVHMEPDLLVVPVGEAGGERWTDVRSWWLAIEVSGRGSRVYDRDHKGPAYLAVGVREFWRADLRSRCVFVRTTVEGAERRVDTELVWQPPEMPTPLILDVGALFANVRGDE